MDPDAPTLAELLQRTTDPSVLLPVAWRENLAGGLDDEALYRFASSVELAAAAPPESAPRLRALLATFAPFGPDVLGFAAVVRWHANALRLAGAFAAARDLLDALLPIFTRYARPEHAADVLMDRSVALACSGRLAEAVAGFDAALPVFERHGLAGPAANCQMNRANALNALGEHAAALAGYDAALPVLDAHAPAAYRGACHMNRGLALQNLRRCAEAVAAFGAALPLLDEPGARGTYALCLMNRGSARADLEQYAAARADYDAALPDLARHAPPVEHARCLVGRAAVLAELGDHRGAVAGYEAALPVLEEHAPASDLARCLTNRAMALRALGDHGGAVRGYAAARRALRQGRRDAGTDDATLAFAASYGWLYTGGVLAGLAGDLPDAAYDSVREGKAGVFDDIALKRARARGPEPQSVLAARKELTHWLRDEVPELPEHAPLTDEEKQQFAARVTRFQEGRVERTTRYFTEWGQHANAYDSDRVAPPSAEDLPTRADVQAELAEGWAVVDFWRTEKDEFHAFVVTRRGLHVVALPFPLDHVVSGLEELLRALRDVRTEPNLGGLLDLGNRLFVPLLPLLRANGVTGLYLVPHEFLHAFPLHAACWYENGRQTYLCDAFDVAYLPSANLLPRLPRVDGGGGAFVMANPEAGTRHSLPVSDAEGRQVRDLLGVPPERCFFGPAATRAATAHWGECGLVHYTGHGVGDERFGSLSHLRLADDLLLAHDVLYRAPELRRGAVVILNGCETAVPDWRAVNESMGLMSAFLNRGAASVFCTQWHVYDVCAAPMALTFAQRVRAGDTPMAAFNAARAALRGTPPTGAPATARASGNSDWPVWAHDFDNPVFWGAFQLVGRAV